MTEIMRAQDAIAASLAECYVEIVDSSGVKKRFNFAQATNVEIKMDKNKKEIDILGSTVKGNKATSWKGTGSATFYYNTSVFTKIMYEYKQTGKDIYFDMFITNDDPNSAAGRQEIIVKKCNLDGAVLAKFDAGGDVLTTDMNFTFEDWEIGSEFNPLSVM